MKQEVFAEELVSPTKSGRFERLSPARIVFSKSSILRVEKISKSTWINLSKKKRKYRCIIPGLIDPHTHLVFAGNRSDEWAMRLKGADYQEIARKGGGIRRSVLQTRLANPRDLLALAQKRLRKAMAFGITTLEIKSGYGLDRDTELKVLKTIQKLKRKSPVSILSTFLGAHALPTEFSSRSEYVDYVIAEVLPKVKGLADFQDVFVEKGYFGVSESVRLLEAGKRYGLKPKVHAHEFGRSGGVEVAARVSAVSADHLQYVNQHDMNLMKRRKIIPVILPGTSFFLGAKKFAPARRMWDVGLKLAIASDFNPGTNPSQNFPLVGTLAAVHQGLQLEEVLTAQTYHAALALGLKDRGILKPGYRADFVCLDAIRFEEMYYHYGQNLVESAFIDGKKVL